MPSKMGSRRSTEGGQGSVMSNKDPSSTEIRTATIVEPSPRRTNSPQGMDGRNGKVEIPSTKVDGNDSAVDQLLQSYNPHRAVPTSNQFDVLAEDFPSKEPSSTQSSAKPLRSQSNLACAPKSKSAFKMAASTNHTSPKQAKGTLATLSVVPPPLSNESRHFLDTFTLRLACRNCFDGKRYDAKVGHKCEGDLLLCQLQKQPGNGNQVWDIIRKKPEHHFKVDYKLCMELKKTKICTQREKCRFCHSAEEQNIWNAEQSRKFDRIEIRRYLRYSQNLPHELPRAPPQLSPAIEGFKKVQPRKHRTSETADDDSQAPHGSDTQTTNSAKTVRKRSFSTFITEKDIEGYKDLRSKVGGHFLLLCEKCFDSAPPVISERSEKGYHCTGDEKHPWGESKVMMHVLISDGQPRYLKIRPQPHRETSLCNHVVKRFGCWRGNSCRFAHNEVEMEVWSCHVQQQVIEKLCTPAFKHRVQSFEGEEDQVALYSESRGVWNIVEGRPASLNRETASVLCRYKHKCRRKNSGCTHPHIQEEVDLWAYMGRYNLRTLNEVLSIAAAATSYQLHQIQRFCCTYCSQHFQQIVQLQQHVQTVGHRSQVASDREKNWKYRNPPWNVQDGNYELCEVVEGGRCSFSSTSTPSEDNSCTKAHSREELDEWKERHKYRVAKIRRARDQKLYSYMGDLLSMHEAGMDVFKEELPDVDVSCAEEVNKHIEIDSTPGSNEYTLQWTFIIKSTNQKTLKEVGLLFPEPNMSFYLSQSEDKQQVCSGSRFDDGRPGRYRVQVIFRTQMLGTFSQLVVFNFGGEPVLCRRLQVDVGANLEIPNVPAAKEPWNSSNSHVVQFTDARGTSPISQAEQDFMDGLLTRYPLQASQNRRHTKTSISETLTRDNYKQVMHEMLYLEERECNRKISRFASSSILNVTSTVDLPDGMHFAADGHMFASIDLQQALMDDSATSQIIVNSVRNVLLKFSSSPNTVYEAAILPDQTFGSGTQNTLYVKLSRQCVSDQGPLTDKTKWNVTVQLQLDRTQFCLKHFAIEQLQNMDMVLPDPNRPQKLQDRCQTKTDEGTNPKQEVIVNFISTYGGQGAPPMPGTGPVLLCGPFGTGKTFTLATAVKKTLQKRPKSKVLICTHSNSAADWYITQYLDSFAIENAVKMSRIYATYRKINSIERKVHPYLLRDEAGNIRVPLEEDVRRSQIVVTTLTTAVNLCKESLRGCFSHILIDEAGQVLEAEALIPLAVATKDTCVVLAGDHIQMCPKIFSEKIRDAGLNKSLLERLCLAKACQTFLTANYRTCKPILDFIAKTYYNQDFQARVAQPLHGTVYPLMFTDVKGTDQQAGRSYVNTHEVLEVVRRVKELKQDWPAEWGPFTDPNSIGVITPCIMQARVIRDSLRREGLPHITVETVDNVQGKQFRAVIISTVRTRKSSKQHNSADGVSEEKFYSSLFSDPKVLNTAFTRTQSLLVVVGDAAALCSMGSCSTKWRKYLKICEENNSLSGTKLTAIHAEVREGHHKLNPNAVPFQPAKKPNLLQETASVSEGPGAQHQQVHENSEGYSDTDSWCTDDDDSEIEDFMLAELKREVEEEEREQREAAAQTQKAEGGEAALNGTAEVRANRAQEGEDEPESIAKVHMARAQDGEAEPETIAKVHMARAQDGEAEPETIAKVHMARAQDGEAEPETIAKVHMAREQDGKAEPESIAKVHKHRVHDGDAEPESIVKVHMAGAQDGEAEPDSIAKVHMDREQDGAPGPESIAKVHMSREQNGDAEPDSIDKVHMARAQDGEAELESIAKVHMCQAQVGKAEQHRQHVIQQTTSDEGQTNQERAAGVNIHNTVQSRTALESYSENDLTEIKMKPGSKSSQRKWKNANHLQKLIFKDPRDRSNLEGASDFEDAAADETDQEYFKMIDKETQREGLRLVESEPDKYKICSFRFESTTTFAIPKGENSSQQICISGRKNRGQALNLDEVVVEILDNDDLGDNEEKKSYGKVICILKRTTNPRRKKIVCTLDKYTDRLMVPSDRTFPKIHIVWGKDVKRKYRQHGPSADYVPVPLFKKPRKKAFGLERVVKVPRKDRQSKLFLVQYLEWVEDAYYPLGYVTEELPVGDNKEDGLLILKHTHGIRDDFPSSVISDIKSKFPKGWQIPDEEVKSRKDLRDKCIFTVDHPETQDLDDALSIEKKDGGHEVGIHIADVSHFVHKDSSLDQEARDRAMSFYPSFSEPVGMLPSQLSTNLCSLLPDQDRLAISLLVTMSEDASVTDVRWELSVIKSKKRYTFEEVEQMIMAPEQDGWVEKVRKLSQIAQKRRRLRLSDGCHAYSHDAEEEELRHPLASSMVEEMMLIANEEVAKILLKKPKLTPLRSQLPPDSDEVSAWYDCHQDDIPNSFSLQSNPSVEALEGGERGRRSHQDVHTLKDTWEKLRTIKDSQEEPSQKMSKITDIICSDENHPQQAVAQTKLHRLQEKATYNNSSERTNTWKMEHHSLKKPSYTHFTSPIRRYMDLVVHRILKEALQNTGEEPYSTEELSSICHHCTNQGIRAKQFEKDSATLHFALKLKETPLSPQTFVSTVGDSNLQVMYPYRHFLPRATQNVPLQYLNPVGKPEVEDGMGVNVTWKLRIYDVNAPPIEHIRAQSKLCTEQFVMKILASTWQKVLRGIKNNDFDAIQHALNKADKSYKQLKEDRLQCRVGETSQPVPEISLTLNSDESLSPFAMFSRSFKEGQVLQVQLHASMVKGLLQPSVQHVTLTPTFGICTEHRMKPLQSFDAVATKRAEKCKDIQSFKKIWLPILEAMSIENAVNSNESLFIRGVKIYWDLDQSGAWCGRINFPTSFCKKYHIRFSSPSTSDDRDKSVESDEEECEDPVSLDNLCIQYTDLPISDESKAVLKELESKPRGMRSQQSSSITEKTSFTAHAIVKDLSRYRDNQEVHFVVKKLSSPFPKILLESAGRFLCTVEVIPKLEQDRRLENAVRDLDMATPLVQRISLMKERHNGVGTDGDIPRLNAAVDTPFGQLNKSQQSAVSQALQQQFTAIQGPPGTGKTIVGATLAARFTDVNKQLPPSDRTPQVLYCGPSNESVNVVGAYLKKFDIRVVRVYSETIERQKFPIPGDPAAICQQRASQESKLDRRLDDIALHNLIRKHSNSHSEKIGEFDQIFSDPGHKASADEIRNYRQEIAKAEEEELNKYDIILCTCNAAGSRRIKENVNAVQCIIDEAGMCSQPETLVPLVATRPEKIVLIGDHKQLRPIVISSLAEELGMKTSLMEMYQERAIMLTEQYRMHESICKFPSQRFYKSQLETAEVVKQRPPEPKAVQGIWPGEGQAFRNVFCHVDGREEVQSVKAAEANENSKANPEEVDSVVQIVFNLIMKCKIRPERILVLSQYRLQCARIREKMANNKRQARLLKRVMVSTVITSQGGERDYIVFSTVRSLPKQEIEESPTLGWKKRSLGFIMDDNQINVALTRAKKGLIIVGNQHLLQVNETWKQLLHDYRSNGAVLNARSFLRRFPQSS